MKPILFNTDMVRAILAGRKTVTRRVVKPSVPKPCELRKMQEGHHAGEWHLYCDDPMLDKALNRPWGGQYLPPFQPGVILYVREMWTKLYWVDMEGCTHYDKPMYHYAADGAPDIILRDADGFAKEDQRIRWRPSINMPKAAARLFLRVTDVRAERLQDILEDPPGPKNQVVREGFRYTPDFIATWENTIKKSDLNRYGWDANPWVWVIEFERCEKQEEEKC